MKKVFSLLVLLIAVIGVNLLKAQIIYVPSGTAGIGTSTVNGNVGIGTSTPNFKLDINGSMNATSGNFNWLYAGAIETKSIMLTGQEPFSIYTEASENLLINPNGGNVGIGTTAPTAKLDVRGNNSGLHAQFGFGSGNNYITVGNVGSESYQTQFGFNVATEKGIIQAIGTSTSNYRDLLLNPNGGKVGIGTATPNNKFEINHGTAGNSGLRFTQLKSTSTASASDGKFLSVNSDGDVILTTASNTGNFNNDVLIRKSNPVLTLDGNPSDIETINFTEDNGDLTAQIAADGVGGVFKLKTTHDIIFSNFSKENVRIKNNGNVGIGTNNPIYKLAVKGIIGCGEIKVEVTSGWADFVFKPNYKLRTLGEVEQFIKTNNHLPEIPTEAEVKENGLGLGEMNAKLLQKIEELTLYLIEQQKRIAELENQNKQMVDFQRELNEIKRLISK